MFQKSVHILHVTTTSMSNLDTLTFQILKKARAGPNLERMTRVRGKNRKSITFNGTRT